MYWKITPYHNADADECLLPGNDELDARAALRYAQARLEEGWDQLTAGEKATVTIEYCNGAMPSVDVDG